MEDDNLTPDQQAFVKAQHNVSLLQPGTMFSLEGNNYVLLQSIQNLAFVIPSDDPVDIPPPPWDVKALPTYLLPGWQV